MYMFELFGREQCSVLLENTSESHAETDCNGAQFYTRGVYNYAGNNFFSLVGSRERANRIDNERLVDVINNERDRQY